MWKYIPTLKINTINLILLNFLSLIYKNGVKGDIIINGLACSFIEEKNIYTPLANEFNKYSKKNNLGITLNLELITKSNSTIYFDDYGSVIDSFLNNKSPRYDLFFYDNIYTIRYSSNMLNLKDYLSQEHINLYSPVIDSESFTYNNKLVGLPVFFDYAVLFSNTKYLNKYGRNIPKTWNDLLDTGKYIKKEEAIHNNTDLMIYNGLYTLSEIGTCSLIESIYSYRDTPESPFPEWTSQNTVDALEMMKEIKNEISSNDEHRSLTYPLEKLMDGNALFLRFCYMKKSSINPVYKISAIPGKKEGISGATIGGYNLGVNKYSSLKKRNEVIKVLKFLTSKEMQRYLVNKFEILSGISSLYDDQEEICKKNGELCELYKNIQPIARPVSQTKDYTTYSNRIREKMFEFLYGDKSVTEVLKSIDDITRIYYLSINSFNGIIITLAYALISIIILISLIVLKYKKFNEYFKFLSVDFWVLFNIGIVMIIIISYLDLIETTVFTCHLKLLFQSIGFILISVPILQKLIVNFPETNKISQWIQDHKYLIILTFIIVDLIFNCAIIINPYSIKKIINNNDRNFQICQNNKLISIIQYEFAIIQILIIIVSLFLTFIEWNIEITYYDVRFYIAAVLVDVIILAVYLIIKSIDIKNYFVYYFTRECIFMIFAISNYFLLYGIKILWPLLGNDNLKRMRNTAISSSYYFSAKNQTTTTDSSGKIINKIMNYHIMKSGNSNSALDN